MMTYHACSKCDAPVRRSRRKNLIEFLIAPIMLPYRCTVCDRREMKLRFIDMDPSGSPGEDEELNLLFDHPGPGDAAEPPKTEAKVPEKAAKPAAKPAVKPVAKPVVKPKAKKEEATKAAPAEPAAPAKAAAPTPQSSTWDEEEEQIFPS